MGGIERREFEARRRKAVEAARSKGLRGLLVCSQGGGSLDRYGDVKYLTDFYTPFPCIPDLAGNWSGRGFTFFILPVDGEVAVRADAPRRAPMTRIESTIRMTAASAA